MGFSLPGIPKIKKDDIKLDYYPLESEIGDNSRKLKNLLDNKSFKEARLLANKLGKANQNLSDKAQAKLLNNIAVANYCDDQFDDAKILIRQAVNKNNDFVLSSEGKPIRDNLRKMT